MTPLVLTRKQVRQVDERAIRDYGMSGLVLMENAGRGVADTICGMRFSGPVLICCGKGNNAGDGFVIARHLDLRGIRAEVLVWCDEEELTGDARSNYEILRHCDVPIHVFGSGHGAAVLEAELSACAVIVDALLGTGAQGDPRPPLDEVIDQMNASGRPIVAVDLPSGLDCDTGHPSVHTVRAAHTCTFVALKPGLIVQGAERYTGLLHVVDIGVPRRLIHEVIQTTAREH